MSRRVESCSEPGTTRTSKIRPAGRSPNLICLPSENSKTSRFGRFCHSENRLGLGAEVEQCLLTFGEPKQDPGPIYQANRTRPWRVELGFPNYPIRMPIHFLDSKALSSLGLFYLVRILSRKPTHTFILQSWKLSQPSSLWKCADGQGSALDFRRVPAGG